MKDNRVTTEDQMNVNELKTLIASLMRLLFYSSSFIAQAARKWVFLLILGLLAGLGLGFYKCKKVENISTYRASMLVVNNTLYKNTYAELINQLDILLQNKQYNELEAQLGINQTLINNITALYSSNINDDPLLQDTSTRLQQPFKIHIDLKKDTGSQEIQNALLAYVNTLPYMHQRNTSDTSVTTEPKAALALIDGFKPVESNEPGANTNLLIKYGALGLLCALFVAMFVEIKKKVL